MRSTPLFIDRRAVRRASIALIGTALLAACDNDRIVSPTAATPAQVPAAANPIFKPADAGTLELKAIGSQNSLVGGAQYKVVGPQNVIITVTDNGAIDADSSVGIVKLPNLHVGSYDVCQITAPAAHALASPACSTGVVSAFSTTTLNFVSAHLPWIRTGYANILGAHIAGGSVTIRDSADVAIAVVADQGPLDTSDADERIAFLVPSAGKYRICATTPPAGFALAPNQPACLTATVQLGQGKDVGDFLIHPVRALSWDVRDGFAALIGPSTFNVASSKLAVSLNVVDNGAGDLDPAVGKFLVQLPKAGSYTVCETVPPPNRYNAKPACVRIDASSGQPLWVGTFVNYEKQVLSP
jgi:hypothetical protein